MSKDYSAFTNTIGWMFIVVLAAMAYECSGDANEAPVQDTEMEWR